MIKIVAILCSCLLMMACSKPEPPYHVDDSAQAALHLLDNKTVYLSDYRGKWVFINYWASWCKPCVREIPAFNALQAVANGQAVILAVNNEAVDKARLAQLVEQFSIGYPSLVEDPIARLGQGSLDVIPTTIVINPEGFVVKKLLGEQTQQQLLALMKNDQQG